MIKNNGKSWDRYFEGVTVPANNGNNIMTILTIVWTIGILLLVAYTVISYWRLRRKVDTAVRYKDNIFQSENVKSPFVLGIIKPRIYLPFNMNGQDLEHVVAHEQAHIHRKDHWWKPFGFLLLTIHWFNPLVWLAYVLLCRDIELACDERVIKELGNEQRADYTQALVACSVNRRMIAACPLAFGEVGVKDRVKSVMNYKKPAFWGVVLAVIVCVFVAVCFLTNPVTKNNGTDGTVTEWFDYLEPPDEMVWDGRLEINLPEFPGVTFRWYPEKMEAVTEEGIVPLFHGMPIWNTYFCDLTGDRIPDLCSTYTFGSGIIDSRIIIYDYANGASYELSDRGYFDFTLRFNEADGYLYVDKRKYNTDELVQSGRLVFKDDCLQVEGFSSNVDEPAKYYLTIGAEGVKSIELTMPNSSGGCENADGSLFKKGERIWLENLDGYTDLRGLTITALGENGEIIWTASIPNEDENQGFTHLVNDDWEITNIE